MEAGRDLVRLARDRRAWPLVACIAGIALVCTADILTGSEMDAGVIYVFPVAWVAWRLSFSAGVVVGVGGAIADTLADTQIGRYGHSFLPVLWNFATQVGLLCLVAWVASALRRSAESERALLVRLEESHRRLDDEVRQVADVQRDLLPQAIPDLPGYGLAAGYFASVRASGDYYDFFRLDGGRLGILVADASGHGPSAAVIMGITRAIVHAHASSHVHPETLLEEANRRLAENLTQMKFVTACYAILDPATGTVEYALAGHPLPILRKMGSAAAVEIGVPQGPPLGIDPGARYDRQAARLEPGDALVLYTDGLTEARHSGGAPIGEEPALRCVGNFAGRGSAAVVDALLDLVQARPGGAPLEDDVTIVVLCRSR